MPRHDDRDRHGNTRLYVGRLSSRTRSRDLEDLFSRYGRVRDVDMKRDFAFVDFRDPRDADEARYNLDGRDFDGSRLIVEFARGGPRGGGGSREYLGRGPPPGTGRCFNCGIDGHWARDCKAGDWKNKCYRCGDRGHVERNCPNSPKKSSKRERSYSRSVSRSPSPRRGRSRSHSYSRSRSPPAKRDRRSEERKTTSRDYSRSPRRQGSSPPKSRSRSYSPNGNRRQSVSPPPKLRKPSVENGSEYSQSPQRDRSPSRSPVPKNGKQQQNGSEYSHSPRPERDSRSPMNEGSPYKDQRHQSPEAANGQNLSPGGQNGDDHRSP